MLPLSFRNAITEPEKVIAPMATPRPISIRLCGKMLMKDGLAKGVTRTRDPERLGVEVSRRADQHRGHADEAVEGGDQLRHRRHLDLARGDQADPAADEHRRRRSRAERRDLVGRKRRDDSNRHAEHAGAIAAAAALRARQAPQRENEADARDQIGEQDPGGLLP